ncbi:hypothetical protein ACIP3A_27930 [Streptomyces tricolor]|uniref:hypothetical protein n=1 Tax=Streptomyces tricolor TaxID=68277 RepID=UPI0037FF2BD1
MNAGSFPAWASVLDLSSVRAAACNSPPAHLKRTSADIRRADPGTYQLTYVSGAPLRIDQRRQDSGLVCGDHRPLRGDPARPQQLGARIRFMLPRRIA